MQSDDVALLSGGVMALLYEGRDRLMMGNVISVEPGRDDEGNYSGIAWVHATNGRSFRVEIVDCNAERGFASAADEVAALAKELRG